MPQSAAILNRNRHLAVLHALIIRHLMARFGRENLGFFWFVLEPALLTAGVMTVWSVIREPYIHNIPIISFVLTGYMPLTLWRHMTNPMIRLFRNSGPLMYHRPVSYGHIIVARLVLEFFAVSGALSAIYLILVSVNVVAPMQDPGLVLAGWLFIAWYYGAQGLVIAALTEYWEVSERFIQPIQYLALPVSGVFFMVDWVPGWGQGPILWNPSVHCIEMFRAGYFGESFTTYYDPWYITVWAASLTFIGGVAVYRVRDRIRFN